MKETLILKVIVGSQAHGLADEKSDTDYRGVFVCPTSEILKLGSNYKSNHWIQGKTDETTYELAHFLHLATHCNPSILEVFKAPIQPICFTNKNEPEEYGNQEAIYCSYGDKLRNLFPYVWNPKGAFDAFCGYSKNQEVKFLDDKIEPERKPKFACAYLRTLYNLEQLLVNEDFTLDVTHNPSFFKRLKSIRAGDYSIGDVIDEAKLRKRKCENLLPYCNHKPDLDKVNEFLLKVRKEFWK